MMLKIKRKNVIGKSLQILHTTEKLTGINDTIDVLSKNNEKLAQTVKNANELLKKAKKSVKELNVNGSLTKKLETIKLLGGHDVVSQVAVDLLTSKDYKLPYLQGQSVEFLEHNDVLYCNVTEIVVFNGEMFKTSATRNLFKLEFANQDFLRLDVLELVRMIKNDTDKALFYNMFYNESTSEMDVPQVNLNTVYNENRAEVELKVQELNIKFESIMKALEVYANEQ